jgi:translation initiation factor 5A
LEKTTADITELKEGGFILIDDAPCRIEKVTSSTSGKHGARKFHIDALGILDNRRRTLVKPSGETVFVPILLKKKAQVLAITQNKAQIMDLEDFSVLELDIPEERKGEIKQGEEIDYFEVCDVKTLKQLK